MVFRQYDLHSFNLLVDCENVSDAENIIRFDRLLLPKAIDEIKIEKPSATIAIELRDPLFNEIDDPFATQVMIADNFTIKSYAKNPIPSIQYENSLFLEFLDGGNSKLSISNISADIDQKIIDQFLIIALDYAVANNKQSLCHAACILLPDKKSVVLIHAPSGTGKTTTSMALTSLGYLIISDDASGISCSTEHSNAEAWGIPRAAKVHKKTIEFVSELKSIVHEGSWDEAGEQFIERAVLIDAGYMADAGLIPIKAVIKLQRDPLKPAGIEKLDKFNTIKALLEDNFVCVKGQIFPSHNNRMNVFGELVKRVDSYRLNANASPLEVAQIIDKEFRNHKKSTN